MDRSLIAAACGDGSVRRWDIRKPITDLTSLHGHSSWVECLAVRGNMIVSGSGDATVRVWDTESGTSVILYPQCGPVKTVALSEDGTIAAGGCGGNVTIWHPQNQQYVDSQPENYQLPRIAFYQQGTDGHSHRKIFSSYRV